MKKEEILNRYGVFLDGKLLERGFQELVISPYGNTMDEDLAEDLIVYLYENRVSADPGTSDYPPCVDDVVADVMDLNESMIIGGAAIQIIKDYNHESLTWQEIEYIIKQLKDKEIEYLVENKEYSLLPEYVYDVLVSKGGTFSVDASFDEYSLYNDVYYGLPESFKETTGRKFIVGSCQGFIFKSLSQLGFTSIGKIAYKIGCDEVENENI